MTAGRQRLAAFLVHTLTASGVIFGALSMLAAQSGDRLGCFGWLALAFLIDGADGYLARRLKISAVLPNIDGAALDLVVDYVTYVLAPVYAMHAFGVFPDALSLPLSGLILISALYTFARRDMKDGENDFAGFPAVWNLVAAGFVALHTGPWICAALAVALSLLTFTSLRVPHPLRVRALRPLTVAVMAVWMAATGVMIHTGQQQLVAVTVWSIASAYLIGLCVWRSMRTSGEAQK